MVEVKFDAILGMLREKDASSTGSGTGDMNTSVYDTNVNGVVDNAEALNGQDGDYYIDHENQTNRDSPGSHTKLFLGTDDEIGFYNDDGTEMLAKLDANGNFFIKGRYLSL